MLDWHRLAELITQHPLLFRTGEWLYTTRRKVATCGMLLLVVMLAYHVVFGANGMVAYQHKRSVKR